MVSREGKEMSDKEAAVEDSPRLVVMLEDPERAGRMLLGYSDSYTRCLQLDEHQYGQIERQETDLLMMSESELLTWFNTTRQQRLALERETGIPDPMIGRPNQTPESYLREQTQRTDQTQEEPSQE